MPFGRRMERDGQGCMDIPGETRMKALSQTGRKIGGVYAADSKWIHDRPKVRQGGQL